MSTKKEVKKVVRRKRKPLESSVEVPAEALKRGEKLTGKEKKEAVENAVDLKEVSTTPAESPEPDKKIVKHEGVEVVSILDDGKETEDSYHCKMANGTTTFVPKKLFN